MKNMRWKALQELDFILTVVIKIIFIFFSPPSSTLVGLPRVKRDKYSVFNFLTLPETASLPTTQASSEKVPQHQGPDSEQGFLRSMCGAWSQYQVCWETEIKGHLILKIHTVQTLPPLRDCSCAYLGSCCNGSDEGWYSAPASRGCHVPSTLHSAWPIAGSLMFLNELQRCNKELVILRALMLCLCPTFQNPENHPDGIHPNKKRRKIPLVNS